MKNQKGITLIALVVTIIVLLILAGISIAMLTGENGIIRNAQEAATYNAYAGADEQFKLAYMAVRTEIMAQTVKDGTYKPTKDLAHLASIVKTDLNDTKWDVSYGEEDTKTIYVRYRDTAIDQGVIDTGKPAQEGQVTFTIVVVDEAGTTKQTCTPAYDTATVADPTVALPGTAATLNVKSSTDAVAPYGV